MSSVCVIPNSASYYIACKAVISQIGPAQQAKHLFVVPLSTIE